MNNKTNLLEEYVIFFDTTAKQIRYFKILTVLFVISVSLFSFYLRFISHLDTQTNNTFSLDRISKTFSLDFNLMLRQYKRDLMARFMEIKSVNPKLGQYQIARELCCSSASLQRYRHDINMLSPYRIPSSCHKKGQKFSNDKSNSEQDLKKP